ncbi:hypothetical protein COB52_03785 [Candidatus Kaiserbacteria bacterium]|nr:MAG: hypothetical protein COB52_03785 [Candidatus Kaiserbacteria bacterium]
MSAFTKVLLIAAAIILIPNSASADVLPIGVIERASCGNTVVDIQSSGTGMMHGFTQLTTSNARVSAINAVENCAVIQWDSSAPAATMVLYAELTDEPVSIDLSKEGFGYSKFTTQNNAGIASHTAVLKDLESGKAYSYRLVTRAHPSALPVISDPFVFITGQTYIIPTVVKPIVVIPPVKKPVVVIEKPVVETPIVPAAITAATEAMGDKSKEGELLSFFAGFKPDTSRLSLSSSIGLFEKDKYIVPLLFLALLLYLAYRYILPMVKVDLKNPVMYWLVGSVVLTVGSAALMYYYITLVGIAVFLAVMAWYLLKSVGEEELPKQPKLLETKHDKNKRN